MRTKIINANLATILFEFKNSLEPSKYTFAGTIDGISGIEIDGIEIDGDDIGDISGNIDADGLETSIIYITI